MTCSQSRRVKTAFDSNWVLIENPEADDNLEVRSGTVLWHGTDREEIYRHAVEIRPKRFAMVYTGKMAKNTAIVFAELEVH